MMEPGGALWRMTRLFLAAFCWLTAVYAFVTSSAFAYLQFIRPRVFPSVGAFSDSHAISLWIWVGVLCVTLWPDLRRRGRARFAAAALLLLSIAAATWSTFHPVLPSLTSGGRSILVGALALVPLAWLGVIDHLQSREFLRRQRSPAGEEELREVEGRVFRALFATALFATALYGVLASVGMAGAFEPDLASGGLAAGLAVSALDHVLVAAAAFLIIVLVTRLARGHFVLQYALLFVTLAVMLAIVFEQFVVGSIGLGGAAGHVAAGASAVSIAATWAGLRLRRWQLEAVRHEPDAVHTLDGALDVFFGPVHPGAESARRAIPLVAVVVLACGVGLATARLDWDALLLKCGVVIVWLTAFGAIYRLIGRRALISNGVLVGACLVPLAIHTGVDATSLSRHALDRYAVYNASFRVAGGMFRASQTPRSFDRFLRANTGLTDIAPPPIDIDFVSPLAPSKGARPNIFLFLIDSLRPDYLGVYNPNVHFTPAIDRFASESAVFTNAFTRYGATGLSVPAIWAGAAMLHKQYIQPFHPMNALEKLLDANGYRRFISFSSVERQLLVPSLADVELDRGDESADSEFCRSLNDLNGKLAAAHSPAGTVFAYARPLDVHISRLTGRRTPPAGEYAGLFAPYADALHTVDGCFGRFIDGLKQRGEYDRSLIVLMSDHGEMLGEDGRFGHSYHMFPPVVRVPPIVHLPTWLESERPDDLDAMRLSTDITPTLYAALGYRPARSNDLFGRPFIGEDARTLASRRRERVVLAASYGAVYAVLDHNGRRLYIADAVNGVDYEYERGEDHAWKAVDVTEDLRAIDQFAIRQYVDEISRMYHVADRQ